MRHVHADRLDACPACHAAGRAEAIAEVVAYILDSAAAWRQLGLKRSAWCLEELAKGIKAGAHLPAK